MKKQSNLVSFLPWFICILGALFYAYEYFLRITPSVMTADLMRYYHIDDARLGNLSAYYYYIYTPMQLIVGVLMDRYGPRRLLSLAILCCIGGTFLFALTPYIGVAEAGRFLIGFGSAFAIVGVLKLATIWLPERYFAMFSGMAIGLGMLGAIFGDIAMSHLVTTIGWKNTVFMSGIFGVVLAFFIAVFVRDHNKNKEESQQPAKITHISTAIKGLLVMIKSPQMWIIGAIGCFLYLPISAFAELWGIPYLHQIHHFSNQDAAWVVSLVFWGWLFGGPVGGWVSDTIKRRNLPTVVSSIIAAVLISAVLYVPNLTKDTTAILLFLFGFFCAIQVIVFAVGREISGTKFTATAISFVNMVVMLGGVIFQPLIGYILDLMWGGKMANGIQVFDAHAYQVALTVLPVGIILAAVLAQYFLKETHCVAKPETAIKKHFHPDMEVNQFGEYHTS